MNNDYLLLSIDQGTTSSRAIVFDQQSNIVAMAQQEFAQLYPDNGWVEHDPEAIWSTTLAVSRQALIEAERGGGRIAAIGISNQRETSIVWDRQTGRPIYNAIVWQDRRTADLCKEMKGQGLEPEVQQRSGLLLDPYFSATKIAWILDHVESAREKAEQGQLAFGTVDCFLIWRLTGGKLHATDMTNASRTNLFNIHEQDWDSRLLDMFRVPRQVLPEVRQCADNYGHTHPELFGRPIPILGVAGDQQAAAIGQCCFNPGDIKSTYGTGCFVLMNTGSRAVVSQHRLLTTIAYRINGQTCYALEGSIFVAGAAVQWLRDGLGIIKHASQTESMAQGTTDNQKVYLVPAFTGLGAPYWDPEARGAIFGLTRSTGPAQLARATLESVCYQTRDLLDAMHDEGCNPVCIRVDGGMVENNWLMQFLADILSIPVDRPRIMQTSALGAAYLAGLQLGTFEGVVAISNSWRRDKKYIPQMEDWVRRQLLMEWRQAVQHVLT